MAGFNRIQKLKPGTGLVYVRFRKTTSVEQMMEYATKAQLEFVKAPAEYDVGIFSSPNESIETVCKRLMKDYDYVFLAREHRE